jgi:UDP-3-O-[3-hydroxymyristoyl] glucosamine N-acyltransferase
LTTPNLGLENTNKVIKYNKLAKKYQDFITSTQILNESLSYVYKIPKNRTKQMCDFYVWDTIWKSLPDGGLSAAQKAKSHLDDSTLADLYDIAEDAINKLAKQQKEDLLDAGIVALTAEIRHLTDNNSIGEALKYARSVGMEKEYKALLKNFALLTSLNEHDIKKFNLSLADGHKFNLNIEKEYRESMSAAGSRSTRITRQNMLRAFRATKWNRRKFAFFCEGAFAGEMGMSWTHLFGGDNWAKISEVWQRLNGSETLPKTLFEIDAMYSLEHNTGAMLNKVKEFEGPSGYEWIKEALDIKYTADITHINKSSSIPNSIIGRYNRIVSVSQFRSFDHFKSAKIVTQQSERPTSPYKKNPDDDRRDDDGERKRGKPREVTLYKYETDDPYDGIAGAQPDGTWEPAFGGEPILITNPRHPKYVKPKAPKTPMSSPKKSDKTETGDRIHPNGGGRIPKGVKVAPNAFVSKNVKLSGRVEIGPDVKLYGKPIIQGRVKITGDVVINDQVKIAGNGIEIVGEKPGLAIFGKAGIFGSAYIRCSGKINENAMIEKKARMFGVISISGKSLVTDDAAIGGILKPGVTITDSAIVSQNARVEGIDIRLSGKCRVQGETDVLDKAEISDRAVITDKAIVKDYAKVRENAMVMDRARIFNNSEIRGKATIGGSTHVYGNSIIKDNVTMDGENNVLDQIVYGKVKISWAKTSKRLAAGHPNNVRAGKRSGIKIHESLEVIRPSLSRLDTKEKLEFFVEKKLNPKMELYESIKDDESRAKLAKKFEDEIAEMIDTINKTDKALLQEVYGITKM